MIIFISNLSQSRIPQLNGNSRDTKNNVVEFNGVLCSESHLRFHDLHLEMAGSLLNMPFLGTFLRNTSNELQFSIFSFSNVIVT